MVHLNRQKAQKHGTLFTKKEDRPWTWSNPISNHQHQCVALIATRDKSTSIEYICVRSNVNMRLASHHHCNQHSPVHVHHHLRCSECLDLDCRVQKGKHSDGDRVTECNRMHFLVLSLMWILPQTLPTLLHLPGTSILAMATNFKTSPGAII